MLLDQFEVAPRATGFQGDLLVVVALAADLVGASGWEKFTNVALPWLLPVLVPGFLLGNIWTFKNTLVVWLVSNGGQPADATHILVTYIYKVAFTYSRYSYAAAFSVVVFLMLLGVVVYVMRRTSSQEHTA